MGSYISGLSLALWFPLKWRVVFEADYTPALILFPLFKALFFSNRGSKDRGRCVLGVQRKAFWDLLCCDIGLFSFFQEKTMNNDTACNNSGLVLFTCLLCFSPGETNMGRKKKQKLDNLGVF